MPDFKLHGVVKFRRRDFQERSPEILLNDSIE